MRHAHRAASARRPPRRTARRSTSRTSTTSRVRRGEGRHARPRRAERDRGPLRPARADPRPRRTTAPPPRCIFHGSQNGQPVPFIISDPSLGAMTMGRKYDVELRARGGRPAHLQRVARRLLLGRARAPRRPRAPADVGHRRRDRRSRVGARARAARRSTSRSRAGPAPSSSARAAAGMHYYNDPMWEPFWAACEDLGMPLVSHGGAGDPQMELAGGDAGVDPRSRRRSARRPIHRLIFAGVFERYPDLKLVLTELPGDWWRIEARRHGLARHVRRRRRRA